MLLTIGMIFYQGIEGSYSSYVASLLVSNLWDTYSSQGVFSFKELFENVVNQSWIGVVPIENSYAWSVHQNFFLFSKYNVKIIGEYYLPIRHALLGIGEVEDIKKVISHPQALMQTEDFVSQYWWETEEVADTALAAKIVAQKKDPSIGAIASPYAWKIYGLNVLKRGIQDQDGNTTRFFVIVPEWVHQNIQSKISDDFSAKPYEKVSVLFRLKDIPAALYKALGAFATRGINLTKIESVPAKQKAFEYIFWLDLQKNVPEKLVKEALEELEFFSKEIKVLGVY